MSTSGGRTIGPVASSEPSAPLPTATTRSSTPSTLHAAKVLLAAKRGTRTLRRAKAARASGLKFASARPPKA